MPATANPPGSQAIPQTGSAARQAIRDGRWTGHTAGLAPGYVQGNLAILPSALATDFMRFCQLNPKPCPVLAVGAPGDWRLPSLGEDLDIRTDVPRYRVFRNGECVDEPHDISKYWRDDLVAFGKPFISNPDLVRRLREHAPLNELDKATLYGGGAKGYTDYPTLEPAQAAQ